MRYLREQLTSEFQQYLEDYLRSYDERFPPSRQRVCQFRL